MYRGEILAVALAAFAAGVAFQYTRSPSAYPALSDPPGDTFPVNTLSPAEHSSERVMLRVRPVTVTVTFEPILKLRAGWAAIGGAAGDALAYTVTQPGECHIHLPDDEAIELQPLNGGVHGRDVRVVEGEAVFLSLFPHELAHCLAGSWHSGPQLRTLQVRPAQTPR